MIHHRTDGVASTLRRQIPPVSLPRPAETGAAVRPEPVRSRRSLAGYLAMPRPGDVVKALLMPLTFGLGVLATGGADGRTLLRALLVLVVLEFLVYPARYQWNDIRGFASDQRHPGGKDRGRLPGPLSMARQRIIASSAVAVLRLAVAAGVALLPGLDLGGMVIAVIAGVFGVAFVYEALRAVATGRHSGDATPPVTVPLALLWFWIGAGYAVRGTIGLALAMDLRERPALAVAAAVTLWAYGITIVTSRWAVESLAHARLTDNRVSWAADASNAREHLLGLTRWLPSAAETGTSLNGWTVLRHRTPLYAPWNVALVVTGAAASVTGLLLTDARPGAAAGVAGLLGAAAALTVAAQPSRRPLIAAAGAVVLLAAFRALSVPDPLVALLPWLAVLLAYLHFSAQCLETMGHLGKAVRAAVCRALTPVARLAVGHGTWQAIAQDGIVSGGPARG